MEGNSLENMNKIKSLIKLQIAFPDFRKQIKKIVDSNKKKWILVGTPIHNNLGDHLITQSELEYLNRIKQDEEIIEIPMEMFILYGDSIQRSLKTNDIIFINGGGWMGTIWPEDEKRMQSMLRIFKKNNIIVFPQTIYFDKECETLGKEAEQCWNEASRALLCTRDYNSWLLADKVLKIKKERRLLLPDVALLYKNPLKKTKRRNVALICLREDKEKMADDKTKKYLDSLFKRFGLQIHYTSTLGKRVIKVKERERIIRKKLKEFSSAKIIVTDRLHGMIFAFLSGTPCVALDNKTKKVSGVYKEWLTDIDEIRLSSRDKEELKRNIEYAITKESFIPDVYQQAISNKYNILERIIKEEL